MSETSEEELERRFRETVDAFIDVANQRCEAENKENVGLALLYAAARFNAFVVASHAGDLGRYEADLDRARQFFRDEYARMLDENLDDYRRVFQPTGKYAHLVKPASD